MSQSSNRPIICGLFALLTVPVVSCKKPEVAYYEIPREESKQAENTMPANHPTVDQPKSDGSNMSDPAMANLIAPPDLSSGTGLSWTTAEHWIAGRSSTMRLGSYTLPDNPSLDISITRFPGDVGGLLSNVNRWRGQLGLAPINLDVLKTELGKRISDPFTFDMVRLHNPDNAQKMLVALLDFEGNTWFFKMSGPTAAVDGEENAFFAMVDSVTREQP